MSTSQEKSALRLQVKEHLQNLSSEEHTEQSNLITKHLIEHISLGSLIAAYWELPGEASLKSLIETLKNRGDQVYLPSSSKEEMVFRKFENEDNLVRGPLGTLDPPETAEKLDVNTVTHILVPGIAFDHFGHRLGRGKGGYDKWLARHLAEGMTAQIIGIALDCQLVEEVPIEIHDIKMNIIATPSGLIAFK